MALSYQSDRAGNLKRAHLICLEKQQRVLIPAPHFVVMFYNY